MKKYYLLFLLSLPFLAQSQNLKGPYVGLTTQLQNTWVINDEQYENVNYRHNFTLKWAPIGGVLGYKFNENHNVQLEAIRSYQGETFDLHDVDGNKSGEKEIDLVYWNIPLLFKYTTPGKLRFNFHFGPQVSILQKGSEENRFSRTANYIRDKEPLTIQQGNYLLASTDHEGHSGSGIGGFNKYDLGIAAGTGLEYSFTDNLYLSANVRYHYNFVDIRDKEYIRTPVDPDYYVLRQNMVIGVQLGINYLFNTGDGSSNARHQ